MSTHGKPRGVAIDDLRCDAVPATADRLPELRRMLADWATRTGLASEQVEELTLAAYEAMANVVEHAYPDATGTFDLHASQLPSEDRIDVAIVDRGQWQPPPSDPGPLHGRGLPLMRDLADNVNLQPSTTGTTAVLRWSL